MNTAKLWFWIFLDVLVVVIIFTGVPALSKYADSFTPARTISVSAQGMTTASPDLAEISFSVVTQGNTPSVLSTNNNSKMSAVLQFVSSEGVASSDIATTNYDLEPNYQYDATSQRNYITGYTLTQTVQVKIHDLTKVADVLGGLAPLGVNEIGGVNFTFNDPDAVTALARTDALGNAQMKAQQMAGALGASLGSIVNISESNNIIVPQPFPETNMMASVGSAASAPTIEPGTQNVTDNVSVTYALN